MRTYQLQQAGVRRGMTGHHEGRDAITNDVLIDCHCANLTETMQTFSHLSPDCLSNLIYYCRETLTIFEKANVAIVRLE
jgi:hypothetical protein